jgi:divalent metal cation (Fe/Co/Zn/Cd) transporter
MFTASTALERYAWLSVAAALATITLKTLAWWLTGSVGLLSDALESIVNLAAALLALTMLRVAASPPDENHPYGFSKAEYFAAGIEGALIVLAAAGILASAIPRLIEPQPLEAPVLGLVLSAAASGINLAVGVLLIRVGRKEHSIALEADGHHLMTDVWTSAGVIAGVALVVLTGWLRLDCARGWGARAASSRSTFLSPMPGLLPRRISFRRRLKRVSARWCQTRPCSRISSRSRTPPPTTTRSWTGRVNAPAG